MNFRVHLNISELTSEEQSTNECSLPLTTTKSQNNGGSWWKINIAALAVEEHNKWLMEK